MRKEKNEDKRPPNKKNCFGSPVIVYNCCDDSCEDHVTKIELKKTLKNYVTDKELDKKLDDYVTEEALEDKLEDYVNEEALGEKLEDYVTEQELEGKLNEVDKKLEGKTNNSDSFIRQAIFMEDDEFIVPDGITTIYVTATGGGGGGGASGSTVADPEFKIGSGGGAGGGAATSILRKPLNVQPFEQLDIKIGSGGLGGKAAEIGDIKGEDGEDGGTTFVGRLLVLPGGTGGGGGYSYNPESMVTLGGGGLTKDPVVVDGLFGGASGAHGSDGGRTGNGGSGADTVIFSGAGKSVRAATSISFDGQDAQGFGCGGSGAGGRYRDVNFSSVIGGNGGKGKSGIVIIEW